MPPTHHQLSCSSIPGKSSPPDQKCDSIQVLRRIFSAVRRIQPSRGFPLSLNSHPIKIFLLPRISKSLTSDEGEAHGKLGGDLGDDVGGEVAGGEGGLAHQVEDGVGHLDQLAGGEV